jgi:hypothetical protein
MYQFMRAKAVEGAMKVAMANGRKVELYTYRLVREERLVTPAGEFDTLHFERVTSIRHREPRRRVARQGPLQLPGARGLRRPEGLQARPDAGPAAGA